MDEKDEETTSSESSDFEDEVLFYSRNAFPLHREESMGEVRSQNFNNDLYEILPPARETSCPGLTPEHVRGS
jgi:hypothetical protein